MPIWHIPSFHSYFSMIYCLRAFVKEGIQILEKNPIYIEDSFELEAAQRRRAMRKKRRRTVSYALSVLIVLCACMAAYQGWMLARYYLDLRANEKASARAADVFTKNNEQPAVTAPPSAAPGSETPAASTAPEAAETPVPAPSAPAERAVLPGILALRAEFGNEDIVGFLSIEGTNVQYAVAQSDNNSFYISHGIDRAPNAAGAIFMDSSNNPGMNDYNTIIYGHNMKNRAMFHDLRYYTSKQYFREHNIIVYQSLYEETRWEVFAFYPTDTSFNYINTVFPTEADFEAFLAEIKLKSVVSPDFEVTPADTILTLSTCTNTADDMRFALHARLIPAGAE